MVNAGQGDTPKDASPSLGRRHKLQFSVCILFLLMFTISVEEDWGVIGRAVHLAVYCQPQMVNARAGRRAERRVAQPWLTLQTAVPLVYCLFRFAGC